MKFPSPTSAEAVVAITNLSRRFGSKVALDDVSLYVPRGSVFGLVGENGAGKTTLIKHILGLLRAEAGTVRAFGLDPVSDPVSILGRIGYLSEQPDLPGWMRVDELLRYTQAFYPKWDAAYARELLGQFGLNPAQRLNTLSKGQSAKAGLLIAQAHRPELLLLDEPSSGLDPLVRRTILEAVIRTVADEGRTVFFSSHLLEEIERVSDQIAMLHQGKLVLCGPLDEIKAQHRQFTLHFEIAVEKPPVIAGALSICGKGKEWTLMCNGARHELPAVAEKLGARIVDERAPSLNEIFVAHAGAVAPGLTMRSPLAALAWEMFRRGRRSLWLILACVSFCALINRIIPDTNHDLFSTVFGALMVLSFGFLLGLLNCTEYNSTREWNGFPYRLFVLPFTTWQLVAVPMVLGLAATQLLYLAWIKLVWTHQQIAMPGWFAVVLGAYFLTYQMILWSLAGFRIFRTVVLSVGGVSGVFVAALPAIGKFYPDASPWLSEKRLSLLVLATLPLVYLTAWAAVARQRHGGGRRRNWLKALVEWLVDALPRHTRNFDSPAAAQFWFEWRRAGWLLPVCVAFALIVVVAPLSWKFRTDAHFTIVTLCWLIAIPMLLGFIIGKGFIKPDFAATNLSVPPFLAVRPLPAVEFVAAKLKVAAVSVVIAWIPVVAFVVLWLSLWADTSELNRYHLLEFRMFYPHSWRAIIVLYFAGFMVLTWRCMVSGLWLGLSGKQLYYFGSMALQVIVPSLLLLACAIWSDDIDRLLQTNPDLAKSIALEVIGWTLALLVIGKLWFAAHSWSKINPHRTRQYVLLWAGATCCFIGLAILSRPPFDTYRQAHVNLLAALLLFPFARLGAAPKFLEKNRAR